jgi:hypothetical protein
MAEQARYLYAVCRGIDPSALSDVPALGEGRVELVPVRDLQGVVSTVDLEEFGEEGLRENLERLEWVERTARGHDAVVQACAVAVPTAPMRLATICLDDDSVRRRLEEWYDGLDAALARIAGREEWSVKVTVHAPAAREKVAAEPAATGAAYLRRKKAAGEERREAEARALAMADDVDRALGEVAVARRRLGAQDPRLSGAEGTMLLNGAYLVDAEDGPTFAARVGELVDAHPEVSVSCGGPWPPYSFATLDQP